MKYISIFCLLLIVLLQVSVQAKIYGPKRYDYRGLVGYVSGDFYTANEFFNNNGEATKLASSGNYMLIDIPVGLRYVINKNWGFEAELKASYAKSDSKTPFTGGERTNSGIHEARVATDFFIPLENFDLIPEIEFVFPFSDINTNSDDVLLNEGATSLSGKLHLQTEFGMMDLFGYLGYEMRGDGRSHLLPWSAALGRVAGSWFFGGRVFGFQSLTEDNDTDQKLLRQAFIDKVNGGAPRFFGVNPNSIAAEALLFWQVNRAWQMQLHAGVDLAGENYSKGIFSGLSLVMDFGTMPRSPRRKGPPKDEPLRRARGTGIAVEPDSVDFKEDTQATGDEQDFFDPPPAPRVQPTQKNNSSPSEEQLQQQLNDAEMKIELKKKKKR
jgi:hypothetical protein